MNSKFIFYFDFQYKWNDLICTCMSSLEAIHPHLW
jgi:hypothetical protein